MASITTTLLRLLAIEAVAPWVQYGATTPIWPTLLEGRAWDSGAIPFDRSPTAGLPTEGKVGASVYTDEVRGEPRGESAGYAPQDLTVDLIFDIEIPVIENGSWGVGETDAKAAALLDATAAQIRRALAEGPTGVGFRRLAKGIGRLDARGTRHPELSVRLARATLRLPITIDDDDWSDVADGLPAPAHRLRGLFPPGSYGAEVLDGLADLWNAPADPTPLESIHFGVGLGAVPTDLATAPITGAVDLT